MASKLMLELRAAAEGSRTPMPETVLAMVQLRLEKLEATVFVGNVASRRVFEKNGFLLEGTIRRAVKKRGRLVDEWLFGLLPEEL